MSTLMNDDPSDPLNLLLHHSQHNMQASDDDSSPSIGTPPDWNSLSSMWPPDDPTGAPRQYLLGAFALFSFFANANVSSPSPQSAPHVHEGHVLTPVGIASKVYEGGSGVTVGSMGLLQAFHLLASAAVLVSVVWPVGRGVWARYLVSAPSAPVLEKLLVEGKGREEEEGSETETETDGERSAGSGGSLSEEDVDVDVDAGGGSAGTRRGAPRGGGVLYPLRMRLRTAFRLYATSTSSSSTSRSSALARVRPRRPTTADASSRCSCAPSLCSRFAARLWAGVDSAAERLGPLKRTHTQTLTQTKTHTQTLAHPNTNLHTKGEHGRLRTLEAGVAVERLRVMGGRAFIREVLGSSFTSTASTSTSTPTSTSTAADKDASADADTSTDASTNTLANQSVRWPERESGRGRKRWGALLVGGDDDAQGALDGDEDGEDGEQEGAEADVEKLLCAIVLYRRVFGSPSASASLSPCIRQHERRKHKHKRKQDERSPARAKTDLGEQRGV
ncbi:hypothetical protein B0H16DRAFT_1741697 [Mycena metata]|uniref:Uncharacterized protein n=1 Tax=Mycena metata TaxID=1033252 RepID=A0AAD7MG11_9AGAR|nr:hypothetical protein B0H16DRAFT_1741697 [Mycena metata]